MMKPSKRLLALCAALMLCVGCAACAYGDADTRQVSRWHVDAEQMVQVLTAFGLTDAGLLELVPDIVSVVNRAEAEVNLIPSRNEISVVLRVGDTALVDGAIRETADGKIQVASSLLPGVIIDVTDEVNQLLQTLNDALPVIEGVANYVAEHASDLLGECTAWAQNLETVEEVGVFSGDAYSGALSRTVVRFDDRDLAVLGMRLLNKLDGVSGTWSGWGEFKSGLQQTLMDYASGNACRYVYVSAKDAEGKEVGASLTVFRGDDQILTLSAGADGRIVIGWGGSDGRVYYADVKLDVNLSGDGNDVIVTGTVALWLDPAHTGFRAASAQSGNRLFTLTLDSLRISAEGSSLAFEMDATLDARGLTLREHSAYSPEAGTSRSDVYLGDAEEPFETAEVVRTDDPVAYTWPDAEPITLNDQETITAAFKQGVGELSTKLINVIPMPILLRLVNGN